MTQDSAVLRWSSIPEEDARGFLLGYYIYYSEYQQGMRVWKSKDAGMIHEEEGEGGGLKG